MSPCMHACFLPRMMTMTTTTSLQWPSLKLYWRSSLPFPRTRSLLTLPLSFLPRSFPVLSVPWPFSTRVRPTPCPSSSLYLLSFFPPHFFQLNKTPPIDQTSWHKRLLTHTHTLQHTHTTTTTHPPANAPTRPPAPHATQCQIAHRHP